MDEKNKDVPWIDIRKICDMKPWGVDMLGGYVKECVKSRQIICRDGVCFGLKRCKRFPKELAVNT